MTHDRLLRLWILLAGIDGFVAVGAAAFGAHGFPLDSAQARWMAKGSDYQFIHGLAMLAAAWLADRAATGSLARRLAHTAALLFISGILLFSGSLYIGALAIGPTFLAPYGGYALMFGWLALAVSGLTGGRPSANIGTQS